MLKYTLFLFLKELRTDDLVQGGYFLCYVNSVENGGKV